MSQNCDGIFVTKLDENLSPEGPMSAQLVMAT